MVEPTHVNAGLSEPLLSTNDVEIPNTLQNGTTPQRSTNATAANSSTGTNGTVSPPWSSRSLLSLDLLSVEDKDIVIRSCFPMPCGSRRRRRRRSSQVDDTNDTSTRRDDRQVLRLNHNVFWNFVLMITYGISEGLWGGAVFAAYCKQLYKGRNAPLGIIEAVYSIAELVFAVPIGYLADTHGKAKIIRAGAALFLVTSIFHAVTTYWIDHSSSNSSHTTTVLLVIIMSLWGIGAGIVDGPCEALFADSTPPGRRTKYYTYLEIINLLATVLGPLLSLIIFHSVSSNSNHQHNSNNNTTQFGIDMNTVHAIDALDPDEEEGQNWNMRAIVIIIYVGLAMEACNSIIMMFFDDDKALVEQSITNTNTNNNNQEESSGSSSSSEESQSESESESSSSGVAEDEAEEVQNEVDVPATPATPSPPTTQPESLTMREQYQWTIPYILLISEVVSAGAMGLSDAYFPLFLKDDCGLSPTQVQILYAIEPLFIAAMTWWAERIARKLGRIQTIVLLSTCSVSVFAIIPIFNVRSNRFGILMILHILSSSFGDSIHPLEEALLADSLPRNQRARWMSLNGSLSGLHQSATAIIGGYLSDYWGYRGTFLATCVGEIMGLAIFALLLLLQPPRRPRQTSRISNTATSGPVTSAANDAQERQPLLVERQHNCN
ncbi:Major Facilitator Superfamily [Seminavis robusta]|uniref:Major Facilitator Superfamily n=1 Tax=Seminavis robusta TaxID=568900 RepID=A0A9N8D8A3_9STRA|nr:Major Facilitator Superfamily [Seminavis robusta]|eukprot:Sro34_g021910.1 Major Facilitator Superfamily (662) ;mRNA; f:44898-46883